MWHKVKFLEDEELTFKAGDLLMISFDQEISRRIKPVLYQFSATPSHALDIIDCGTITQSDPATAIPILQEKPVPVGEAVQPETLRS